MALDFDEQNVFEDEQPWYRSPAPWVVVTLLAAVIGGFSIHALKEGAEEKATSDYLTAAAQAATPEARLKLAQAHLDLPATAGELMTLGAAFADAKNYDGARTAFGLVTDHFADNPLAAGARLGAAQALEAQGKLDEAIALLQKPYGAESEGYRPLGLLVLGRLQQGKKNFPAARQSLQDLVAKYPQSAFVPEAQQLLAALPAS
jgi:predicted negative regulator of RcsB-dependent stress response